MKTIKVSSELMKILLEIKSENKTIVEWREVESSDSFQSENFCGGFDETEDEFTFSYYFNERNEYWFQFSLIQLEDLVDGIIKELAVRKTN